MTSTLADVVTNFFIVRGGSFGALGALLSGKYKYLSSMVASLAHVLLFVHFTVNKRWQVCFSKQYGFSSGQGWVRLYQGREDK